MANGLSWDQGYIHRSTQFFIDDDEKNLTLRTSEAGAYAHTQLWELLPLTIEEVREVAGGFGGELGTSIAEAASHDPSFFDIVSRPSMLPVVATIWGKIEDLRRRGHEFTSAILLEHYIRATYDRKEEELRQDQFKRKTPDGTSYLILPREVRELLTTAVVWRMAAAGARNTIRREIFNEIIRSTYDGVLQITQAQGVNEEIAKSMRAFEERFKDESRADRIERVSSEIASASLFVPDPAGGQNNLRFPHKQFYEYFIAKAGWLILYNKSSLVARWLGGNLSKSRCCEVILSEPASAKYLSEMIDDFHPFRQMGVEVSCFMSTVSSFIYGSASTGIWPIRVISKGIAGTFGEEVSLRGDVGEIDEMIEIELYTSQRASLSSAIKSTFNALNIVPLFCVVILFLAPITRILENGGRIETGEHGLIARSFSDMLIMSMLDSRTNNVLLAIICVSVLVLVVNIVAISVRHLVILLRVLLIYKLKARKTADGSVLLFSMKKLLDYRIWRECLVALRRKTYSGPRSADAGEVPVEISAGERELQHLIRPLG